MSTTARQSTIAAPLARSIVTATLLGATFLLAPLPAAHAQSSAAVTAPAPSAAAEATSTRAETVEQRITSLHASLKITADEDSKWNNVAQSMRENAAAMQKLVAERTAQAPQSMTAVQDLTAYEKFAQAHVDGLKNLTASFKTLYAAMPDAQKKLADGVFQTFDREGAPSRS